MDFTCVWLIILLYANAVRLAGCERTITDIIYWAYSPLPWDKAQEKCTENGGSLLEISDPVMDDFYQHFKTNSPWVYNRESLMAVTANGGSIPPVWIGLIIADSQDKHHVWPSSCQPLEDALSYFPDTTILATNQFCVTDDTNGVDGWVQRDCTEKYPFICQKQTNQPCDYETKVDTDIFIQDLQTPIGTVFGTFSTCLQFCWFLSCWSFTRDVNDECKMYSENVADFLNPENYKVSTGRNVTIIQCYKGFTTHYPVKNEDLTGYDAFPDNSCSSDLSNSSDLPPSFVKTGATSEVTPPTTTVLSQSTQTTKSPTTATSESENIASSLLTTDVTSEVEPLSTTVTPQTSQRSTVINDASTSEDMTSTTRLMAQTTKSTQVVSTLLSTVSQKQTLLTSEAVSPTSQGEPSTTSSARNVRTTTKYMWMPGLISTETEMPTTRLKLHSVTPTDVIEGFQSSSSPVVTNGMNWVTQNITSSQQESNQVGDADDSRTTRDITLDNKDCVCDCLLQNFTTTEQALFISGLLKTLTHDPTQFSSYRRKYISIVDKRPSAKNVGICGVVVLLFALGGLILLDLSRLWKDLKDVKGNIVAALETKSV